MELEFIDQMTANGAALADHDHGPELVEQVEFNRRFVAVAERVFTDPVAAQLFNVGVVVVFVGPTPRQPMSCSSGQATTTHLLL